MIAPFIWENEHELVDRLQYACRASLSIPTSPLHLSLGERAIFFSRRVDYAAVMPTRKNHGWGFLRFAKGGKTGCGQSII